MKQAYAISLSGRVTLNLHSLNNEGGEGNQISTRMVNIIRENGELANVNAVSGDMLKHIQAEHLFHLATDGRDLPLCAGCRLFNANRISADNGYLGSIKGTTDAQAIDLMLERCAMDDIEGNLVTADRSLPRKSILEFGWVVALPEASSTDSYFHVKYASERSEEARKADAAEEQRKANLQQNIFHRPASSGIYAVVANLETARIGYNDISQQYAISDDQRALRYRALLESVLYTFIEPAGAMRSTQNPHILGFEGIVTVSKGAVPAPTVSPLKHDYHKQLAAIIQALEPLQPGRVEMHAFADLAEFTSVMTHLIQESEPFKVQHRRE
jgi:CRISPR-associated protein Cst2